MRVFCEFLATFIFEVIRSVGTDCPTTISEGTERSKNRHKGSLMSRTAKDRSIGVEMRGRLREDSNRKACELTSIAQG